MIGLVLAAAVPIVAKLGLGVLAGVDGPRSPTSWTRRSSCSRAACAPATACSSPGLGGREAEEPTSVEFARIVNQTRVARRRPLAG